MITISEAYRKYPRLRPSDRKWTRGYMPRTRESQENALICIASGIRKGELYYNAPSWTRTRNHYKVYLDISRLTSEEKRALLYDVKCEGGVNNAGNRIL